MPPSRRPRVDILGIVLLCLATLLVACRGEIGEAPNQELVDDYNNARNNGTNNNPPDVDPQHAWVSGARRLSNAELDKTIEDLLGDDTNPARRSLNEDEFAPYDNDYTLQSASAALINSLNRMSQEVAQAVIDDPALRDQLVGCTPTGPGDEACFRSFVETFVRRALRRAITAEEVDEYMAFQDFATEDNPDVDNDFYTGVALVIRAVLMDPEFLYRIERGDPDPELDGVRNLNGFEIATRMSYLFWGSTPSDRLLDEAEAGTLDTPEGRRAAATWMLDDPRARDQIHRFHAMWLGYRTIPASPELVSAFNTETTALIDRVVFDEPGDYMRLFTMNETFVDADLAAHYELPAPAGETGWVPYRDDRGRAGILGHGSVLAAFSKFTDTSPTQRGILVRTRLMCQQLRSPPPDVDVDQPPGGTEGESLCKIDRYAAHRDQSSSCASCHSHYDPIGFGLEQFDIAGRYRLHDDGLEECTIDGQGEVIEYGPFSGPAELSQMLIDNEVLDACAVRQLFTYAIGRAPENHEQPLLDDITAEFRNDGSDFKQLLTGFVASERFARRVDEPAPEDSE